MLLNHELNFFCCFIKDLLGFSRRNMQTTLYWRYQWKIPGYKILKVVKIPEGLRKKRGFPKLNAKNGKFQGSRIDWKSKESTLKIYILKMGGGAIYFWKSTLFIKIKKVVYHITKPTMFLNIFIFVTCSYKKNYTNDYTLLLICN